MRKNVLAVVSINLFQPGPALSFFVCLFFFSTMIISTQCLFTLTWQKFKLHHLIKAPSTRLHDIFFNPQLFLSGFGFRPLKHPVNAAYESASCLIRCAEWKFLNTLWIRNLVDGKSGYVFLSGEVTRSSLILYREYCIQEWQPRRMLCCQYSSRNPGY